MTEEKNGDICGEELEYLSGEQLMIKLKECRKCWYQARCVWFKEARRTNGKDMWQARM